MSTRRGKRARWWSSPPTAPLARWNAPTCSSCQAEPNEVRHATAGTPGGPRRHSWWLGEAPRRCAGMLWPKSDRRRMALAPRWPSRHIKATRVPEILVDLTADMHGGAEPSARRQGHSGPLRWNYSWRFHHAHNKKTNPKTLDIDRIDQRMHGHEEIRLELLGGNGGRARHHGPFWRNELGRALIR
jgi:hypothetical protein